MSKLNMFCSVYLRSHTATVESNKQIDDENIFFYVLIMHQGEYTHVGMCKHKLNGKENSEIW